MALPRIRNALLPKTQHRQGSAVWKALSDFPETPPFLSMEWENVSFKELLWGIQNAFQPTDDSNLFSGHLFRARLFGQPTLTVVMFLIHLSEPRLGGRLEKDCPVAG
jgi:hypothetical protein